MTNKVLLIFIGVVLLSAAAYANTTPSANCTPFPLVIVNPAGGSGSVSCPAFSVPGATLTGVTLTYRADYQFGNTGGATDIAVTFVPAGPGGVTWTPASQKLDVLNDAAMDGSSGGEPAGGSNATAGVSTAAFAAAFNVNISSAVVTGTAATSSGAVSIVYTYTPAPALTLACPASTGTVGVPYSSALVASGGVPAYGPYAIFAGSISPLMLNPTTGAITGTPTTAGPLTFTGMVTDSIAETATTTPTITIASAPPPPPPGVCNASTPVFPDGSAPADAFLIRYATNLNIGDSFVDLTNTGAQVITGPGGGTSSNLCVNVYTFDAAEELISCCGCLVTPNGLQSLSVVQSLISNPLTPAVPSSVVVKLVASVPGTGTLDSGLLAWGTTLHQNTSTTSSYGLTETPFSPSHLSSAELTHITSTCGFIQSNGSGFGICGGCPSNGLGASTAGNQ